MTDTVTDLDEVEADLEDEAWEAPAELAADDEASHVAVLDDRLIVVSAFAGIGGFDLGFERAGFQTGAVIEWDAAAARVLAVRFPHAARFTDVRNVNGASVRRALGGRPVHILTGGFPCQDLSVAGRRAGMAGKRSGLYGELLRLAEELDPDWLVVENVPGLLSADADPEANDGAGYGPGSGFALFLGDVTGYRPPVPDKGWRNSGVCSGPLGTASWRVLDARHFGVAQRRRRVFVVVNTRDRRASAAVLLEPESMRRDPSSRRPSWARAAASVVGAVVRGRGVGPVGDGAGGAGTTEDMTPTWTPDVSVPLGALTGGQRQDLEGMTYVPVATNAGEVTGEVAHTVQATNAAHGVPHVLDRPVGHVEASGGDDVSPTVTSKWAKGRGGPAGSETGNLVTVPEGEGPAYDYAIGFDRNPALDSPKDEQAPPIKAMSNGQGTGSGNVHVAAYPAEGRDNDGVVAARETGQGFWTEDDVASALRVGRSTEDGTIVTVPEGVDLRNGTVTGEVAMSVQAGGMGDDRGLSPNSIPHVTVVGDGGTDVSHPVTASGTDGMGRGVPAIAYAQIPDGYELVTIPEDDIDTEVERRLADGGAVAFDWQAGGSGDESWRGKARSWIVKKGDYAGALSTSKVQAVAYIVDKERGVPNDEGIRVEETDVAPPLLADGDPAERTDRGTRIVQDYAPDVAAPLTAGSHSPGVSAPGRRQEDDANVVAVYRKARNAQTSEDDETWIEADHANTLNTFDGGDARAKEIVIEHIPPVAPALRTNPHNNSDAGMEAQMVVAQDDPTQLPSVHDFYGNDYSSETDGTPPLRAAASKGVAPVLNQSHAAVRRLTPRECERLQGFPDDHTLVPDAKGKPATDSPRYKQLGNAVCVNVSEWVGCRIWAYDAGMLG